MKLAFTTLGCPNWDLDTIISRAKEYGYDGVDFRGYGQELAIYKLPEFSAGAARTARRFQEAGLEVSCFSSSVRLFPGSAEGLEEISGYTELCRLFGTSQIRAFGGKIGETPEEKALQTAADTLHRAAEIAHPSGVTIVVETHDDWLDCRLMRRLMERVQSLPNVGVLWDVHHPYRMLGEKPETTWQVLGQWIRNTHVKDSRLVPGSKTEHHYVLPDEGDIPLRKIVNVLRQGGYNGYLTLEWEKRWHPDLAEPEVAFPRYVEVMRALLQG